MVSTVIQFPRRMRPTWRKVREGRWQEQWATCLLHLESEDGEHLWLEEEAGSYVIGFGGKGCCVDLARSTSRDELQAHLEDDAAIESLFERQD